MSNFMNAKEVLVAAKNLLSDPSNWTKGAMARTISDVDVNFYAKNASCWCALGAVNKILFDANEEKNKLAFKYLSDAASTFGYRYISDLNDQTDHDTVMKLFDVAIKLAA
jgi:hypothetical protein